MTVAGPGWCSDMAGTPNTVKGRRVRVRAASAVQWKQLTDEIRAGSEDLRQMPPPGGIFDRRSLTVWTPPL